MKFQPHSELWMLLLGLEGEKEVYDMRAFGPDTGTAGLGPHLVGPLPIDTFFRTVLTLALLLPPALPFLLPSTSPPQLLLPLSLPLNGSRLQPATAGEQWILSIEHP